MGKAPGFWRGLKVLITAGPTREHIDPIRFLTNASSGRMGLALAREARLRGARPTVVLGPTDAPRPAGVTVVAVVGAKDMRREVLRRLRGLDVFIAAAAVGDWGVARPAASKIKRTSRPLMLALKPNPDIVAEVGKKRGKKSRPLVVGFALETHRLAAHAGEKLRRKNLDVIIANGPENLGAKQARFMVLDRAGCLVKFPSMTKERAAAAILGAIEAYAGR